MILNTLVKVTGLITYMYGEKKGQTEEKLCHAQLIDRGDGAVLYLEDGPTGYESFYIKTDAQELRHQFGFDDRDWCACFGTEGRWHKLDIPAASMRSLARDLRII